jgi:PEP-CTERM motif
VRQLFLCFAICGASLAHAASILVFDDLGASAITIPDTYGDRLAGTPNIDMSYATMSYTPQTFGLYTGVAAGTFPSYAHADIIFTPDPGFGIHLISFDMGLYQGTVLNLLNLVDGNDVVLEGLDPNVGTYFTGNRSYAPDFYQPGVLKLEMGTDWYTGLDNIRFDQFQITSAVPEPSTLGIIGLSLAGLALLRRRHPAGGRAMRGQEPSRA